MVRRYTQIIDLSILPFVRTNERERTNERKNNRQTDRPTDQPTAYRAHLRQQKKNSVIWYVLEVKDHHLLKKQQQQQQKQEQEQSQHERQQQQELQRLTQTVSTKGNSLSVNRRDKHGQGTNLKDLTDLTLLTQVVMMMMMIIKMISMTTTIMNS